jgi:hypothetical protein
MPVESLVFGSDTYSFLVGGLLKPEPARSPGNKQERPSAGMSWAV